MNLFRSLFPLLLVLAFSFGPGCCAMVQSPRDLAQCADSCCSHPESNEEKKTEKPVACNPFQCHTCCFFQVPFLPSMPERVVKMVQTAPLVFYQESLPDVILATISPPPQVQG